MLLTMEDQLLSTAEVAKKLGVTVTTVNRWALDPDSSPIGPAAMTFSGKDRIAARLYRAADIQDAWDRRVGLAILKGACSACSTFSRQVFHDHDCPVAA